MNGEGFEREILAIVRRRALGDSEHLRTPKKNFLRNFAEDTREWVLVETKDDLLIIERLLGYNNDAVNLTVQPVMERLVEIRRTYMRHVVSPLRAACRAQVRDEAEHWMKFRQVMEPAINLILELLAMRPVLRAAVNQTAGSEAADKLKPSYIA